MDRNINASSCVEAQQHTSGDRWTSGTDGSGGGGGAAQEAGSEAGSDIVNDMLAAGYQPLWVRLACIFLDFLTQTYDQIRIVPEIVLFERWLCEPYLPNGVGYSHELCKSDDIQYQLAQLRSGRAFFDGVASMTISSTVFQDAWILY